MQRKDVRSLPDPVLVCPVPGEQLASTRTTAAVSSASRAHRASLQEGRNEARLITHDDRWHGIKHDPRLAIDGTEDSRRAWREPRWGAGRHSRKCDGRDRKDASMPGAGGSSTQK